MRIPLKYNFRSLWVRRAGTLMTALGIAFTVSIVITMLALANGLDSMFVETGRENDLIVIRRGSQNEVNSYFNRGFFQTVRYLPGVSRDEAGDPLACAELVVIVNHPRLDGKSSNFMVRGTSQAGFRIRPEVRIVEGRGFREGLREVIVSRSLSGRFQNMALGDSIRFARGEWKVVGIFDAGGTAYDSELWADYQQVAQDWDRPIYNSITLRAESSAAAEQIQRRVFEDQRIQLQAIPQKKYFADQTTSSIPIKALGFLIAIVMGIGASFAAMNMMYGAVMARSREVGTLRAIGFKRRSILASFLVESVCLSLIGGALGCLMALPMHGISTGTANFQTLNEVLFKFRITPGILLQGLLFSLIVGAFGGYLPARRAARAKLIAVLRD